MSDDTTQHDPSADAIGTELVSADDAATAETSKAGGRGKLGLLVLAAIAVAVLLTVAMSAGAWGESRTPTAVPDVIGRPVPVANKTLAEANLAPGAMPTVATSVYGAGIVVDQSPEHSSNVLSGSRVDMLVAVAPTMTVVPDVTLDTTSVAGNTLSYSLLTPKFYEQLSDSVDSGRVVAQMPRAGQPIMTGQPVAVFVSVGPGVSGAVVPDVVGQSLTDAANRIADVYLLAELYYPRPDMLMSEKVTDQLPAPGTRVPVGSTVPVFVAP
jgi:beta-lactam-binding protein with PASTA domain